MALFLAQNNDECETPRMMASSAHLECLNDMQRQAVETIHGPLLVLAGAGTGKTRVLITRLAHILLMREAHPSQILAVTFTNKAAQEMRARVERLIGHVADGMWLGTFHSIAARILRYHAELAGLQSNFTILDTDDQLRLLTQIIKAENFAYERWPARAVLALISRWKDRGLSPDKVTYDSALFQGGHVTPQIGNQIIALYKQYQERLRVLNAVDFGDLLLLNLELFAKHPDILKQYQQKFHFLMVDEYQDSNIAQYLWLRLLAQGSNNLCCVGDDDQSIYGWRGAEVSHILKFERDFPQARIIRLEQNYRSSQHILGAASGLIAHNQGRLGKTLWTEGEAGEQVAIQGAWDGEEEARFVGEEIEALQREGVNLSSIAILVRAGFQTREFEDRFIALGLPYRVIGGLRFYERMEIRDALAYLRLAVQPQDSLAFERIVNTPKRGIGDTTVQTLHTYARDQNISLTESARRLVQTDELNSRARGSLISFLQSLERWRSIVEHEKPGDAAQKILDEAGYTEMWQNDRSPEAQGRLENLKELVAAIAEFGDLQGFLEHVSLVTDANSVAQTSGESVSIMTLHSAKGLEFDVVFLAGWEEGLFPHGRAMEESGVSGLEEERRLAYVGLTRARRKAIITFAAHRFIYGSWQRSLPSRFLKELPQEHIILNAQMGLHVPSAMGSTWEPNISHGPQISPPSLISSAPTHASSPFKVGARVFHQKFGYGRIVFIEGDKLDIDFEHTGRKKVMSSFIKLG